VDHVVIVEAVRTPTARWDSPGAPPAPRLLGQTLDELLLRARLTAHGLDGVATPGSDGHPGGPGRPRHLTLGPGRPTGRDIIHRAVSAVADGTHGLLAVGGADAPAPALPREALWAAELSALLGGTARSEVEAYAHRSRRRAWQVHEKGEFKPEIVPVSLPAAYAHSVLDADELPALPLGENASPAPVAHPHLAHAAAALLLTTEHRALELGLRPRARFLALAEAEGDPDDPAVGIIRATREVLRAGGLTVAHLDHHEIDETFAPVPLLWHREFDSDPNLLNPRGGALAFGHLADAAALRATVTMLGALEATGGCLGLVALSPTHLTTATATIIERIPQPDPPAWWPKPSP
jgi:acetyl-CoA C-acetyltransferase